MLPTLNRIESWIEAIFAYVSSEAINHGVAWDGYKVVEGRSKRQFLDTKSVVAAAEKAGYTDIYKTELISLTEFEKLMGKKKFKEILGEYVVKHPVSWLLYQTLIPERQSIWRLPRMSSRPLTEAGHRKNALHNRMPQSDERRGITKEFGGFLLWLRKLPVQRSSLSVPHLFCQHLRAEEHQWQRGEVFRFLSDPEGR